MKAKTFRLASITDVGIINNALNRVLISNVKDKKEKIGVLIQNETSIRNIKQNALIHALFQNISDATASFGAGKRVEMPEIKAMLKHQFLGYRTYKINDKKIHELKNTSKLTKKECSKFTQSVLEWCIEYGIEIQVKTSDYDFLVNGK